MVHLGEVNGAVVNLKFPGRRQRETPVADLPCVAGSHLQQLHRVADQDDWRAPLSPSWEPEDVQSLDNLWTTSVVGGRPTTSSQPWDVESHSLVTTLRPLPPPRAQ